MKATYVKLNYWMAVFVLAVVWPIVFKKHHFMCFPKALDLPLHVYPHKRDRSSELKCIIFKLTCKSKHNALCKHAVSLYSTLTK